MDSFKKCALLAAAFLFSGICFKAYAAPGDILSQFSINNVSGDSRTPSTPQGIAYFDGFLWVADFATDRVYRVYPETVYDEDGVTILFNAGDSDLNIPIPDVDNPPINSDGSAIGSCFTDAEGNPQYCGGGGLTVAENYLWNASAITDDIIKLDPVDGDNLETENALAGLAFPAPTDMAYDGNHFWIMDWQTNTISEVLPEDGSVLSTIAGPSALPSYADNPSVTNARPFGLTWDGKALWVSDQQEDNIYRVDPQTGALLSVFSAPGGDPKGLTWDGDTLWHVDQANNMIYRLDPGVIPIGLVGCVQKNGVGVNGDVLLSQPAQSDQVATTDSEGCFIFSSFTSGAPIQVSLNEQGVDQKPVITLQETSSGNTEVVLVLGESYVEPGYSAVDTEDGVISSSVIATPDVINAPSLIDTSTPRTYTIAYDVVDSAGNMADTVYRQVSVLELDTSPPVISLLGDNPMLIEQNSVFVEPGATAADDRDGDLSANITVSGVVDTSVSGTYTLSYDVADSAGNAATTVTRSVVVRDTVAPVLTLLGANPLTHEKGAGFVEPGYSANDNIDGDISANVQRSGSVPPSVGSYVLTYQVTDSSGNVSNIATRTVNVVDTQAPVITLIGSTPMNTERDEPFIDPGAMAIDAPSENISADIVVGGTVDTSVVGAYTLTYDVSDASGNVATTVSRIVNVVDSGPVITLNGANPLNHSVNTPFVDPGATAFDDADGDLTANIVTSSNVNVSAVGTYSVTYNVVDSANNSAPTVTRVVNVNDFDIPVITLVGAPTINVELGDSFTDPGATAFDNADGDLTASINRSGSVITSQAGNYVLTYTVSDSAGNAALAVTRTVIVSDTDIPVVTLNGDQNMVHELGASFVDPGASAYDSFDGAIPVVTTGSVNESVAGTYTLRYDATDSAGNRAVQQTRVVQVVNGPTISLIGGDPINHQINTPFTDPGASANDPIEGDISSGITVSGVVNETVMGTYTLNYNVQNSNSIAASQVSRRVVVGDFIAPVITLIGASSMSVEQGTGFTDPGASATDNLDGDISGRISRTGSVNANLGGRYDLTYRVSDSSGNAASPVIRTVNVNDTIAPTLTLNGPANMTHEAGYTFSDPGATAIDTYFGDISSRIQVSGTVNISLPGTYTLIYSVSDSAGNSANNVSRSVTVVDTEAPRLTLNGFATINHEQGTSFTDPGANALDMLEGDISSRIVVTGSVDTSSAGTYVLNYAVSDSAGNAANPISRTVIVSDTQAPSIVLNGAANMTVVAGNAFNDPGASATDVADGDISARVQVSGSVNTSSAGTYRLSYSVSDTAGNSAGPIYRDVTVVVPTAMTFEAESARLVGGIRVQSSFFSGGYRGSGYIQTSNSGANVGDYFEFDSVNAYATPYNLSIRSSGSAGSVEVRLNGSPVGVVNMGNTGFGFIWQQSGSIAITPREGRNTLRFIVLNKGPNIDQIQLTPR